MISLMYTSPPPTAWVPPSTPDSISAWECKTRSDWEPHLHPNLPHSASTQAHNLPSPATLTLWCSSSSSPKWSALFPHPSASETRCRAPRWSPQLPNPPSWKGSSPQTALHPHQPPFLAIFPPENKDSDSLLRWGALKSERRGIK